jgi:hypothetical protein
MKRLSEAAQGTEDHSRGKRQNISAAHKSSAPAPQEQQAPSKDSRPAVPAEPAAQNQPVASGADAAVAADASAHEAGGEAPPAAADSAASALGLAALAGYGKLLKMCVEVKKRIEQPGISEEQLAKELKTADMLQQQLEDLGMMLQQ